MERIFVDSSYIIDYLRGKEYTKQFIEKISSKHIEAFVSVATLFELYIGALLSNNPEKKLEEIESLLSWFQVINLNKNIMGVAAKIHVDLRKKGLTIGTEDILIAASSVSLNLPLLTHNKKHFDKVKNLEIKSWDEY